MGDASQKTAHSRAELGFDRVPSSRRVCQPEKQAFVVKASATIQLENILLTFHPAAVPLLDAGKFLSVPCRGNPRAHAARLRNACLEAESCPTVYQEREPGEESVWYALRQSIVC